MHPLLRYYGGKFILQSKIINMMPDTLKYVEPYCGGCSILLNRRKTNYDLANDIDKDLIQFYLTVQKHSTQLINFLWGYPFCEDSFNDCDHLIASKDEVEAAAGYLMKNRMSYGGLGENYTWSEVPRRGIPRFASTWETVLKETLPNFARRIQNVLFLSQPAIKLIREITGPDTLFYLDPPYHPETRVTKDAYKHEMTHAQHVEMLEAVQDHSSHIFISGFHCPLYDTMLKGWMCKEFDVAVNIPIQGQQSRRVECLWINKPSLLQLFRFEDYD
jgi:DNA adenine methylase